MPALNCFSNRAKGHYANETCFLTSYESFEALQASGNVQLRVEEHGGVAALAVFTDGLEYIVMKRKGTPEPRATFFLKLFEQLVDQEQADFERLLTGYLSNNAKINELTDDDKTLVLAVNKLNPPDFKKQIDSEIPEQIEQSTKPSRPLVKRLNITPDEQTEQSLREDHDAIQ